MIDNIPEIFFIVRKHRAPKGALRRHGDVTVRRKAQVVRKHRAPQGALRREKIRRPELRQELESESTERHKVH